MYQDGFDGPAAITTNMTIKTSGKSMTRLLRVLRRLCRVILLLLPAFPAPAAQETGSRIPVLLYHRFGPVATDSMTVTTAVFESHLKYLQEHGYVVIPLRDLVAHRLGKAPSPPDCSVAIAVDDGHRSVHAEMHPLILQYRVPVTLFVYPSAISNASYAMTWDQLRELARSGLYDIQSHTYWHPNFKTEKRQRTPQDYARFADAQLARAKEKLEKTLGSPVDMLGLAFRHSRRGPHAPRSTGGLRGGIHHRTTPYGSGRPHAGHAPVPDHQQHQREGIRTIAGRRTTLQSDTLRPGANTPVDGICIIFAVLMNKNKPAIPPPAHGAGRTARARLGSGCLPCSPPSPWA